MKHFERLANEMFPKNKKTPDTPQIIVDAIRKADILATLANDPKVCGWVACEHNADCHLRVAVFPEIKRLVMNAICTDHLLDDFSAWSHWYSESAVNGIVEKLFEKWLTTVRK